MDTTKTASRSSDGEDARPGGLVAWQWAHYPKAHLDRRNLLVHALTAPLFLLGTLALAPLVPALLPGALGMPLAVLAQGRGHRREPAAPLPFRGPLDVLARLFVEQWVTFPRFVLTGAFARAWRAAGTSR